ncbi:hypothetical protein [Kordia sp.]|uniref:hypothetical protein n=1 Tax=Kordia sp. TaxID=1965332 RepID=UPI003B591AFB
MKNNWFLISLAAGVIGGFLAYILSGFWQIGIVSAVLIMIVVLLSNPARRYIKAFFFLISVFLCLNKMFFKISGEILGVEFMAESEHTDTILSVGILILALCCLLLDYLQQNDKLKGTIFEVKVNKNKVKNVKGKDIHIHQEINDSKE